jgi:hypothetical protein
MSSTHLPSFPLVRALKASAFAAALICLLPACDGAGPEPGGAYGGLDVDGDGELSEGDVEAGTFAVYLQPIPDTGEADEEAAEAITTEDARIFPGGSGGWYLRATVDGRVLSLRFENGDELSADEGTITNASMDVDEEHFAYASEPGGSIEISEVADAVASGRVHGSVELEVFGMNEMPTGETIRIEAFAFKTIEVGESSGD